MKEFQVNAVEHALSNLSGFEYFKFMDKFNILNIGAGVISTKALVNAFQNASICSMLHPGDFDNHQKILNAVINKHNPNVVNTLTVMERDIYGEKISEHYDLIVMYMPFRENPKFSGTYQDLLEKVLDMNFERAIIIDYLEDASIKWNDLDKFIMDKLSHIPWRNIVGLIDISKEDQQRFHEFTARTFEYYIIEKREG